MGERSEPRIIYKEKKLKTVIWFQMKKASPAQNVCWELSGKIKISGNSKQMKL